MKKAAFVMFVLAMLFGLCYRLVFAQEPLKPIVVEDTFAASGGNLQLDVQGYYKAPPCSFQPGDAKVLVDLLALIDEGINSVTTGVIADAGTQWTYYRSGLPAPGPITTADGAVVTAAMDKHAEAIEHRRQAEELEREFKAEQDAKARRVATRSQFALLAARLQTECK